MKIAFYITVFVLLICGLFSCKKDIPLQPEKKVTNKFRVETDCTTPPVLLGVATIGRWGNDAGYNVEVDQAGNVTTEGLISGNVDMDPGEGTYWLFRGSFRQKLNRFGNFVSATDEFSLQMGQTPVDIQGNTYWTGFYDPYISIIKYSPSGSLLGQVRLKSTLTDTIEIEMKLDNKRGCAYVTSTAGKLFKLSATGAVIWERSTGTKSATITIDNAGNIYITSTYAGRIIKFDSNGNLKWSINNTGSTPALPHVLKVDVSGHVYVAGTFTSNTDFDPGPGILTLNAGGTYANMFIQKLNADGKLIWAVQTTATENKGTCRPRGLQFVPGDGFIFITGEFSKTVNFNWGATIKSATAYGGTDVFTIGIKQCN